MSKGLGKDPQHLLKPNVFKEDFHVAKFSFDDDFLALDKHSKPILVECDLDFWFVVHLSGSQRVILIRPNTRHAKFTAHLAHNGFHPSPMSNPYCSPHGNLHIQHLFTESFICHDVKRLRASHPLGLLSSRLLEGRSSPI